MPLELSSHGAALPARHLHADQDAPVGGAVVAVVEQADIPALAQAGQEFQQGARALGELHADTPLSASTSGGARPPTM
jgi:hypothetical protein